MAGIMHRILAQRTAVQRDVKSRMQALERCLHHGRYFDAGRYRVWRCLTVSVNLKLQALQSGAILWCRLVNDLLSELAAQPL